MKWYEIAILVVSLAFIAGIVAVGSYFCWRSRKQKKEKKEKEAKAEKDSKKTDDSKKSKKHEKSSKIEQKSTKIASSAEESTKEEVSEEKKSETRVTVETFDGMMSEVTEKEREKGETEDGDQNKWSHTPDGKPNMMFEAPPTYEESMGKTPPPPDGRCRVVPLCLPDKEELHANRPTPGSLTNKSQPSTQENPVFPFINVSYEHSKAVSGSSGTSKISTEFDVRSGAGTYFGKEAGHTPIINSPVVSASNLLMEGGSAVVSFTPASTGTFPSPMIPPRQQNSNGFPI